MAATAVAAACTSSSDDSAGPVRGSQLSSTGPQTQGYLSVPLAAGRHHYQFAFPTVKNEGRSTVTVTGYRLLHSDNVPITGYPVYSLAQRGIYLTAWSDTQAPIPDEDITLLTNYAGRRLSIKPGKELKYYAMVRLSPVDTRHRRMTGCRIMYDVGKLHRYQDLTCDFRLE